MIFRTGRSIVFREIFNISSQEPAPFKTRVIVRKEPRKQAHIHPLDSPCARLRIQTTGARCSEKHEFNFLLLREHVSSRLPLTIFLHDKLSLKHTRIGSLYPLSLKRTITFNRMSVLLLYILIISLVIND